MWKADSQATLRAASSTGALALAATVLLATAAPAASPAPEITSSLSAGELRYGDTLTLSGRVLTGGQGLAGAPLTLQSDAYPFRGFAAVAHLTSAPDGSFSFVGLRPDRNTRLRVLGEGAVAASGPVLAVTVDPKVSSGARSLGPGQVRITLRVRHARAGGSAAVPVWWFLAAPRSRVFRLAAVTSTRELSPGVTYASVRVDPPSKRFVYRVCFNAPWEHAMGAARTHRTCPHGTFVVGSHAG